ncbi:MAG: hypothetical protein INR66_12420 [Gordonia polyisoprenivorans]|nr:hypothetical protein [Gordonia polyisoprenivorans]
MGGAMALAASLAVSASTAALASAHPDPTPTQSVAAASTASGGDLTADIGSAPPAHPKEKPIGVSLETLSSRPNAVVIDGVEQPNTYDRNGIFIVVIDSQTRNLLEAGTAPNNGAGLAQLGSIATGHPRGSIVVISAAHGINPGDRGALDRVATAIGAKLSDRDFQRLGANSAFSMVGTSGGAAGTAWTKVAPSPTTAGGGDITGMLRWNSDGLRYDFVPDRQQTIVTSVGYEPNPGARLFNVIGVGNKLYDADTIEPNGSGFHILSLDPQTLAVRRNVTVVTSSSPQRLPLELAAAADPPPGQLAPLVVIQSMGHPIPSPRWYDAASVIGRIGGSPLAFMNMDKSPTGDYALIGGLTAGSESAESGGVLGSPGPVEGVLSPSHDMTYFPQATGPLGSVNIDQIRVVNEPTTDFTPINTAAENWIGYRVNVCGEPSRAKGDCDFRTRYGSDYEKRGNDWADLATRVEFLAYEAGHGFTDEQFQQTKNKLKVELRAVASVHRYYSFLQKIFSTAGGPGRVNVKPVGDAIFNSINPDGSVQVEANAMQFIDKVTGFASLIFPGIKAVTGNLLSAYSFTSYLSSKTDASSKPANPVRVRGDQLTRQIADSLASAADNLDTEARIVVTDPGKLAAAAEAIDSEQWALPDSSAEAVRGLELGAKRWFAEALLPTAYPWLIRTTPQPLGTTNLSAYYCKGRNTPPWKGANSKLQLVAVQGFGDDRQPYSPTFFPSRDTVFEYNTDNEKHARQMTPSDAVVDLLFGTDAGQLRINKFEFYSPRYFGPLRNANVGAEFCDLPRPGTRSPLPGLSFGSSR